MKCPCCGGQPLSFSEFWSGLNAVRVRCHECGRKLKANRVTWAWLMACGAVLTLSFVLLFANIGKFAIADEYGRPLIFLFIFLCAILSWLTGGYVPVAPKGGRGGGGPEKPAA